MQPRFLGNDAWIILSEFKAMMREDIDARKGKNSSQKFHGSRVQSIQRKHSNWMARVLKNDLPVSLRQEPPMKHQ